MPGKSNQMPNNLWNGVAVCCSVFVLHLSFAHEKTPLCRVVFVIFDFRRYFEQAIRALEMQKCCLYFVR